MTTYNNIIEALKDNRQEVISRYEKSGKAISLKDYMNEVINFFEEHPGKARKCMMGSFYTIRYIGEACAEANKKADNTRERRMLRQAALNEHIQQMHCRGWYQKNFQ